MSLSWDCQGLEATPTLQERFGHAVPQCVLGILTVALAIVAVIAAALD